MKFKKNRMSKPSLNACKTSFSAPVAFPYLVAPTKIQKMQESHTLFSKRCVKSMKLNDFHDKNTCKYLQCSREENRYSGNTIFQHLVGSTEMLENAFQHTI